MSRYATSGASCASQIRTCLASPDSSSVMSSKKQITKHISYINCPPTYTAVAMRLSAALGLSALCLIRAADAQASVLLHDPRDPQPRIVENLAPIPARLVLAHRLGVEDFHAADLREDGVVDAINVYGRRTPLFAKSSEMRKAFLLLIGDTTTPGQSLKQAPSVDCNQSAHFCQDHQRHHSHRIMASQYLQCQQSATFSWT